MPGSVPPTLISRLLATRLQTHAFVDFPDTINSSVDEPTEGIQPNIVHEIGDLILRLNRDAGVTILFVEQKLPFARRVASEFYLLDKGHRVAGGSFDELTPDVVREHLSV